MASVLSRPQSVNVTKPQFAFHYLPTTVAITPHPLVACGGSRAGCLAYVKFRSVYGAEQAISMSKITGNSNVCLANTKAAHYWLSVRGIRWWMVDSPHKGPINRFHVMTSSCATRTPCRIPTTWDSMGLEVRCAGVGSTYPTSDERSLLPTFNDALSSHAQ